MLTQQIHIADYNYSLPDERIAKFPLAERDSSKLLIYNKGVVSEDVFTSLPKYIPTGSLMVFNNTKVIQARLHFRKGTPSPSLPHNGEGEAIRQALPIERGDVRRTKGVLTVKQTKKHKT